MRNSVLVICLNCLKPAPMGRAISILLLGLTLFAASGGALAQTTGPDGADGNRLAPESTKPALVAPYDEQLMRLAEVLGSIHYLRELCNANEGLLWREKMTALITAEKPRPLRKSKLISRFNRGYGSFNRTYQKCTPTALVAVDRYMKEGVMLTSQIATRYGR